MAVGGGVAGGEHGGILELLRAAAADTDQMVMIAVAGAGELEAPTTLRQLQLLQQPHRAQQPQGAVHRRQRNPPLGAQQPLMHLLGAEMAAFTKPLEQIKDALALRREPLASVVETGPQSSAGERRLLARGRRLSGGKHQEGSAILNSKSYCEERPETASRSSAPTRAAVSTSASVTTRR